MGWWVRNHIAVNDDETKQLCSIEVDTAADIPAADQSATAGFIIVRGSDAKDIDTGDVYIMDSTGAWKLQPSGVQLDLTGYATTQQLTDGLAAKVDTTTYTAGQAAQDLAINTVTVSEQQDRASLIGQVDGGAKNLMDPDAFTSQTKNGVTLTKNADDSFTITGTFTSHKNSFFTVDNITGIADTVLALEGGENGFYAYARNGNPESWLTSSGGVPITTGVPIPAQNVGAQFDIAIMVNNEDGKFDDRVFDKTVRIMICKAADYAISPAFVPYAPTNRELYEMILALQ